MIQKYLYKLWRWCSTLNKKNIIYTYIQKCLIYELWSKDILTAFYIHLQPTWRLWKNAMVYNPIFSAYIEKGKEYFEYLLWIMNR